MPPILPSHERLYDFWYSTEEQLRLSSSPDFFDAYTGQLRLDAITFRTLVLPDTGIIDGCYFGQTTPSKLIDVCGRGSAKPYLPIEVKTRKPTLEGSLADFLRRPDRDTLNDYPLQFLRNTETRLALAEGLRETPTSRLDQYLTIEPTVPKAVSRLLAEILRAHGIDDTLVSDYSDNWTAWLDAEKSGVLRTRRWSGVIDVYAAAIEDPIDLSTELTTDAGRNAYLEITNLLLHGTLNKSDALNVLRSYVGPFGPGSSEMSSPEEGDAHVIVAWYDNARSRGIARQHAATFAYDQRPIFPGENGLGYHGLAAVPDESDIRNKFLVELPDEFYGALQSLSPGDFQRLFVVHGKLFSSLWSTPNPDTLRKLVEQVYEFSRKSQGQIPVSKTEPLARIFGQLLAGGAAVEVGGPWAGLAMVLGSEGALRLATSSSRRRVVRGVVEYHRTRTI